jgi:hypothetical protein
MPTVTVKRISGKDPSQFLREVNQKIHFDFQAKLAELGIECAANMGNIIRGSIKRDGAKGTLENSIKSVILDDVAGVHIGIGDTQEMPPYWAIINFGGLPPENAGFFGEGEYPQAGASGQQWTHTGKPGFFMKPTKPIEPVLFVDLAANDLERAIDQAIKELSKEVDSTAR